MAEQTADKVKFDKEEDIKPLLIAFRKIFEPITKSMQSIAKIPEEIKRIADNISKDVESGVPKRVANGAGKLTTSEIDQKLKDAFQAQMSEDEIKSLERHEAMLKVLQEQLIPSKLNQEGEAVKLTEKEIIESQKIFKTEKSEQLKIEKQIEVASKEEGLDAEQQATKIQELQEKLEKSIEKTSQLETMLGSKTPQEIQQQERPGFVKPAFIENMRANAAESGFGQLSMVTESLKDTFMNNIGTPIMSLIKMTKKHNEVMQDFAETGEKVDKFSVLKYIAIAAGIGLLIKGFTGFFGFKGPPKEHLRQENESRFDHKERLKRSVESGEMTEKQSVAAIEYSKDEGYRPGQAFGKDVDSLMRVKELKKSRKIDKILGVGRDDSKDARMKLITEGGKAGTTIIYQDVKQDNSSTTSVETSSVGSSSKEPTYSNIG